MSSFPSDQPRDPNQSEIQSPTPYDALPPIHLDTDFVVVVSVGTDVHPYDRLVRWMDHWAFNHPNCRVIIQKGTSNGANHAETHNQIGHQQLLELFGRADVVVCHGGPSTVMDARSQGRKPIVVGRNPELGEHVDGHQLAFAEHLKQQDLAVVVDKQDALFAALDLAEVAPEQFSISTQNEVPPGVTRFGEIADELIADKQRSSNAPAIGEAHMGESRPHLEDLSVSVVIATHHRPVLVKRAIESIVTQNHPAPIEIVVVFDGCEIDEGLIRDDPFRSVRVTINTNTPGLAGSRNKGIELATNSWIALCDDDDEWLDGKLEAQFAALETNPSARAACTGILIRYEGEDTTRTPPTSEVNLQGFVEDRIAAVHPSSWLVHRDTMVSQIGEVDEEIPGSYAEDYDLFIRTSRVCPIAVVEEPLVRVWWHGASYFFERWKTIDQALEYLVNKHPEFEASHRGLARINGQRAVAQAAMGQRSRALATIGKTMRHNPLERRIPLALAVVLGIYPGTVLRAAHRFGRGI